MPDRKKVITALEKALAASKAVDSGFIWITVGEGKQALELLKGNESEWLEDSDPGQEHREKGLAMCIAKKVLGEKFHQVFREWCE